MSIARMQRITLCGPSADKARTLDALQALGVMHLIPLSDPGPLVPRDATRTNRTEEAWRHLEEAADKRLTFRPGIAFDLDEVVARVLDNRAHLRTLHNRIEFLQNRVEALAPWGDIHFPALNEMGGQRLWFYALPLATRPALDRVELPWQVVRKTSTTLYVVVISPEEPPADLLPVPRTCTGNLPRSVMKQEVEELAVAIDQAESARSELTRWRLALGLHLAAAADREDLDVAMAQTLDAEAVFAVQGWVPIDATAAVCELAEKARLAFVVEEPGPEDMPPTQLRTPAGMESGSDLTFFYTSPGYRSWDPSLMVFASFALFFSMIVADAGYAIIIALTTLLFWKKLGGTAGGRRGRVLLGVLSTTAIVYGVLAGSYFGLEPPEGSWLAAISIIDVQNFDQMMDLTIFIGALHLSIALGAVAWLNRTSGKGFSALGWIVALWSGMMLAHGADDSLFAMETIGSLGLAVGLCMVFSGAAAAVPVTTPKDWLKRLIAGAMALTSATKLFGDVLSYLRLFALGLASASLAITFNTLAVEMRGTHPGLGVLLMILILVFGHSVNFMLGVMSGVVHGLRLNFIEFFGWGLTEEGYPFRAFTKRTHTQIQEQTGAGESVTNARPAHP
ncbi:V-type ATP synthase subunit I [Xanthobacter sp. TB0139]|uniref:V-type ATP synthase subunit I n=1 Tax=Xanthobacter sp. TB0139 TaxID=3459178 RepID=UPI004039C90E